MTANLKVVERDPTGKDQHSKGAKLDAGKPRPFLIMQDFAQVWDLIDSLLPPAANVTGIDPDHPISSARMPLCARKYPRAFLAIAQVAADGAEKYSDGSWFFVPDAEKRYTDACQRHHIKAVYEIFDPDSGSMHKAHALWNMVAVTEIKSRRTEGSINLNHSAHEIIAELAGLEDHLKRCF